MKKAVIVHCWGGKPHLGWYGWLSKQLEKQGFCVIQPAMPEPDYPQQQAWLETLLEVVGVTDEDTYFVGHSLGCIAIMRFLELLPAGKKVGGVLFVAGFSSDLGIEETKSFFTKPFAWEKIRKHCPHFIALHSDNDQYINLNQVKVLEQNLGAKLVIKHNMHHFQPGNYKELPVVMELFERLIKK
ncbi:serine hydrolase family protein [Candidatus Woesearchaeota archaeon]|nr:serine hydrolase family protein [Candidatus Woesearchaeota archaeon]